LRALASAGAVAEARIVDGDVASDLLDFRVALATLVVAVQISLALGIQKTLNLSVEFGFRLFASGRIHEAFLLD